MRIHRPALLAFVVSSAASAAHAQTAPTGPEIFLAPLSVRDGGVTVGTPANITRRLGYDNQPAFTADGRSVLFTSVREDAQADIYRYEIGARTVSRVTATPESEYSATVMPGDTSISVIRVEADSAQRLWRFALDGSRPGLVLEGIKPVGYHAWASDRSLVLFVLGARGAPATLQIADTRTGTAKTVAERIGRALQPVPRTTSVSFVQHPGTDSAWLETVDAATAAVARVAKLPAGSEYHVWLPDGSLLVSTGNTLLRLREPGAGRVGWDTVVAFEDPELARISRLALSPRGDLLAFVAEREPPPR